MARPNIVFDKQPTLKRWHYALFFLVAVLVSAYCMWPEERKPVAVLKVEPASGVLAFPFAGGVAQLPQESTPPNMVNVPMAKSDSTAPPQTAEVRIGAGTPWYNAQRLDHHGNFCVANVEALPILELRQLIPPKGVEDFCFYRAEMYRRPNMSPSDYFAPGMEENRIRLLYISVLEFYRGGLWKVSDFEQLVDYDMDSDAVLVLYVLLRDAGSAKAETLKNRFRPGGEMRRELDIYISTGYCPWHVSEDSPCRDHMPKEQ